MCAEYSAPLMSEHLIERPLPTAAERLQFVVRFAQMNLDALRPGDWLNLRDDFTRFFGIFREEMIPQLAPGVYCVPYEAPEKVSEDTIRTLRYAVSRMLEFVVDPHFVYRGNIGAIRTAHYWREDHIRPGRRRCVLMLTGSFYDVFLLLLSFLLPEEPTEHILRCPECETIFYRARKQQYCSRPCVNRANVRAWRQSEEGKRTEAERAHERYKEKQPENTRSKVERRPRKRSTGHAETPRES